MPKVAVHQTNLIQYHYYFLQKVLFIVTKSFMPRISTRRRLIQQIEELVDHRQNLANLRLLDSDSDSVEDDFDLYSIALLQDMSNRRYASRSRSYRGSRGRMQWAEYLNPQSTYMNESEFLRTFRLSRSSFGLLREELERTPMYARHRNGSREPRPCYQQLLVFLYRCGRHGNSGSDHEVALYFGIASGSVKNYVKNIVTAIKSLEPEIVSWPNEEERNEMKVRLAATGFRHCVGIADGTLIPLTRKPKVFHECYFCRKNFYAINVLLVCDDRARVLYYLAGWPGSTHDNRVFKSSNLFKDRDSFFSPLEYIIGDSAYSNSSIMVPAFKKTRNEVNLSRNKELFNFHLAKLRIKSEHCIGLLKGRFQCLKGMNTYISGEDDVKFIVDCFGACCVLHNLLLSYNDEIPQEWYEDLADEINSDIADQIENATTVAPIDSNDGNRRSAVFNSFVENFA